MIREIVAVTIILLFTADAASAQDKPPEVVYVMPEIPTEAQKILALKLAYELNGRSMVGYGRMIDLSGPQPSPPPPLTDEIMPAPRSKEKRK